MIERMVIPRFTVSPICVGRTDLKYPLQISIPLSNGCGAIQGEYRDPPLSRLLEFLNALSFKRVLKIWISLSGILLCSPSKYDFRGKKSRHPIFFMLTENFPGRL